MNNFLQAMESSLIPKATNSPDSTHSKTEVNYLAKRWDEGQLALKALQDNK